MTNLTKRLDRLEHQAGGELVIGILDNEDSDNLVHVRLNSGEELRVTEEEFERRWPDGLLISIVHTKGESNGQP